jgi:hypothetical protein
MERGFGRLLHLSRAAGDLCCNFKEPDAGDGITAHPCPSACGAGLLLKLARILCFVSDRQVNQDGALIFASSVLPAHSPTSLGLIQETFETPIPGHLYILGNKISHDRITAKKKKKHIAAIAASASADVRQTDKMIYQCHDDARNGRNSKRKSPQTKRW